VVAWQGAAGHMDITIDAPTMGLRAPLFLAIWVTMMVAMMFPTAAPMNSKPKRSARFSAVPKVAPWRPSPL